MEKNRQNLFLGIAAAALVSLALLPFRSDGQAFLGSDNQALELISKLNPGYRPWARPLWQPPSKEIESFLFALQAALGSGLLCYYLGLVHGRALAKKKHDPPN